MKMLGKGTKIIFNRYYSDLRGVEGEIISALKDGRYRISYIDKNGINSRRIVGECTFNVLEGDNK